MVEVIDNAPFDIRIPNILNIQNHTPHILYSVQRLSMCLCPSIFRNENANPPKKTFRRRAMEAGTIFLILEEQVLSLKRQTAPDGT